MRQFASTGFRIWNLSREAKLVYTFFCLSSLMALLSSALLYEDSSLADGARVAGYYARTATDTEAKTDPAMPSPGGTPKGPEAGAAEAAGGPRIEMPDEAAVPAAPIVVPASYRKLLEVTHFHLFTVPVFLLIIAHLFMLTGLSAAAKTAWIAGGWLSSLLHIAAPWIVRWSAGRYTAVFVLSGALLSITTGVLTAYPIWAMWFGRPPRPATSEQLPIAEAGH